MLKAYNTYPGEDPFEDGCILVFANNRNEARLIGYRSGPWMEVTYLEMSATRVKKFDKYVSQTQPYFEDTNDNLPEPFFTTEI